MAEAVEVCNRLRAFYKSRALIEEEYANRLTKLSETAQGIVEFGSLGESFNVLKIETVAMAKSHSKAATQLHAELEDAHTRSLQLFSDKCKSVSRDTLNYHKLLNI